MKKFGKAFAIVAALSFMLSGLLASCSSDSGGGGGSTVKVTEIAIDGGSSVGIGGSIELAATVSPDNATNKKVTWTAEPASAVTITPSEDTLTATVTGVEEQAAVTITATAQDGSGISAEKTIAVTKQVKEISVDASEAKATYNVGEESLNTDGIVVTATYSDDSTATVDVGDCTFTGFDSSEIGTKTITVSYSGKEATFEVRFAKITAIAVDTENMKTKYAVGEELNTTGIVITATYSDGENETTGEISADDCDFAGFSSVTGGTTSEITVSLKSDSTVTAKFNVTIKDANVTISSVTIKTKPTKEEYFVGEEELDLTGLVLTLNYSDGDTEEVTYSSTSTAITTTGFSTETANDEVVVTVKYSGFEGTAPTFTVAVIEDYITEWTATLKSGVSYSVGDTAKASDVSVSATYAKAGAKNLTADTDYIVSPTTALATTNTTLTVTLADSLKLGDEVEKSKPVDISVIAADAKITKFTAALADGVSFTEGDTVVSGNLVVKAVYDGDEANAVALGASQFSFAPTAALATTDTAITVTITDETLLAKLKDSTVSKTVSVAITVAKKPDETSFAHTYTIDLTAAPGVWSDIPTNTDNKTRLNLTGEEENVYAGYLERGVMLLEGASANFNSGDGKKALFLTSVSSDDSTITETDVPMLIGTALEGNFRISVTFKATGWKADAPRTDRKVAIYRADYSENDDDFDATKDNYVAIAGQESASTTTTVTYTYKDAQSDDDLSVVGIALFNDMSLSTSKVTDLAAYITEIKIETNATIDEDVFPAESIVFTNSAISDDVLSLTKDEIGTGYTLTAEVSPSYATDKTYTFSGGSTNISVSEAGVVTVAAGMNADETATITVTANGGAEVTAELTLNVKATADDADKVSTTVNQLKTALAAEDSTFTYGDTSKVVANATTFLSGLTFTYSDVTITPTVNTETGVLTFTVSLNAASDTSVTVEYPEALAATAVSTAVTAIKESTAAWTTDATTTKTSVQSIIDALGLVDVTATATIGTSEDNGSTVVVTVTSKYVETEKDDSIVYESPRYEIVEVTSDTTTTSYLNLLAKSYSYYLSKENLQDTKDDNAWSAVATDNWQGSRSGLTAFTDTISAYNLSGDKRYITLNVKGVAKFDLYVFDSNGNRTFTIGDKTYITAAELTDATSTNIVATKVNQGKEFIYTVDVADSSVVTTIKIGGGNNSVYPVGIILYAPSGEKSTLTVGTNVPSSSNDVTISATGTTNQYQVTGAAVTGGTIAWYIDDKLVSGETSATITLPTTLTKGTSYTLRVVVTADGNTYSDDMTVVKK